MPQIAEPASEPLPTTRIEAEMRVAVVGWSVPMAVKARRRTIIGTKKERTVNPAE